MTVTAVNYAEVLYSLGLPCETVQDTKKIFREVPRLGGALADPLVSFETKERIIDRTVPAPARNFIKVAVRHHKITYLDEIFTAYEELLKTKAGTVSGVLRYVTPPTKEQLEGLRSFLCREFKAEKAEIRMAEDPTLIGGFVLTAGGQEYDWSLKGRYRKLQQQLTRR